jgi:hypothetical protein
MQGIPALKDGSLHLASVIPAWGDIFLIFSSVKSVECLKFHKNPLVQPDSYD